MQQALTTIDLALGQKRPLQFSTTKQKIYHTTINSQPQDNRHIGDTSLQNMKVLIIDLRLAIGRISRHCLSEKIHGTTRIPLLDGMCCLLLQINITATLVGIKDKTSITYA